MNNRLLLARAVTTRLRGVPGAVVALDYVRRHYLADGPPTVVINDFDGDLKMEVELAGHMGSQIFWYGSYSRHQLRVLDSILRPGMMVVDAGANAGEITLFCAKRVGSSGRVLSFEPLKRIADRLERNVGLNGFDQVEVVRMGLSDMPGEAALYDTEGQFADGSTHEGLSTIFPTGVRAREVQRIALTTLDRLLEEGRFDRLDVLKVDVEGAELAVLQGARDVLKRFRPWVIVEVQELTSGAASYQPRDILRLLGELGYRFFRIDRERWPREITEADLGPFQNVLARP